MCVFKQEADKSGHKEVAFSHDAIEFAFFVRSRRRKHDCRVFEHGKMVGCKNGTAR